MALSRTLGVALSGITAQIVEVQVDLSAGLPGLAFTGLADTSVVESRDRIRAAVTNSGVSWPGQRITVALLPADVRKAGARFDLAVAVAVLAAADEVPARAVADVVWIAELGLDGLLRPVHGVLPAVAAARRAGHPRVVVAPANTAEARLVSDADVRTAATLRDIVAALRGDGPALTVATGNQMRAVEPLGFDLADVAGQYVGKRALEVAAAGGHHVSLVGSPGAGKTMLAERLPSLLPELDDEAALEVSAVHSVAGCLPNTGLIRRPPLQAPHHTASIAALVGGGSHLARPGAISLAHRGVLFLDEAPEFPPKALDALRQPLESGEVVLHRGGGVVRYPARFQLVIAANPCPCARVQDCDCVPHVRRRYQQRLSGPLLDRVDLRVQVEPLSHADLIAPTHGACSADVARRVAMAREAAARRWRGQGWRLNAEVPGTVLRETPWRLPISAVGAAEAYVQRGSLTARGYDRVLRLAWTLCDLAGRAAPDSDDVAEALYLRTGDYARWSS